MIKFYVLEIQKLESGYAHLVHTAEDEDANTARMKGESVYHQVLAAAAISNLPVHAAVLVSPEGFPVLHQCYKHNTPAAAPEEAAEE